MALLFQISDRTRDPAWWHERSPAELLALMNTTLRGIAYFLPRLDAARSGVPYPVSDAAVATVHGLAHQPNHPAPATLASPHVAPPRVEVAAWMEQAAQMADRFHRLFLRTLRALQDYRRGPSPRVAINQAGQVNVGGAQVNVAAPPVPGADPATGADQ